MFLQVSRGLTLWSFDRQRGFLFTVTHNYTRLKATISHDRPEIGLAREVLLLSGQFFSSSLRSQRQFTVKFFLLGLVAIRSRHATSVTRSGTIFSSWPLVELTTLFHEAWPLYDGWTLFPSWLSFGRLRWTMTLCPEFDSFLYSQFRIPWKI